MPKLQFKLDPNQDFQLQAIDSVVKLFDGLSRFTSDFALGEDTVANLSRHETLEEGWLAESAG